MNGQPQLVQYYKHELLRGCAHGFAPDAELALRLPAGGVGAYVMPVLDTADRDMTYHRFVVDGDMADCRTQVTVVATDETTVHRNGRSRRIDRLLADPKVAPADKTGVLVELGGVQLNDHADLLLHELQGRYLYACVEVEAGGDGACVRGVRIELPQDSFVSYLPEVYHNTGPTLERYMAVFQSLFTDMESRVDRIPVLLDYRATPDEVLPELAAWVGVDTTDGLLSGSELRSFVSRLHLFQGAKGTAAALVGVVELVTGVRPSIVEQFRYSRRRDGPERALYGDGPNHFALILNCMEHELRVGRAALEALIRDYSPLGTTCRLVILERSARVGAHCYLGLNSTLTMPERARADSGRLGADITMA